MILISVKNDRYLNSHDVNKLKLFGTLRYYTGYFPFIGNVLYLIHGPLGRPVDEVSAFGLAPLVVLCSCRFHGISLLTH